MARVNTTLDDISAIVGFSNTLRLVAWYGAPCNQNLYIPAKPVPTSLLVRILGETTAKRLCDEWGGNWMTIPSLFAYDDEAKRRSICVLICQGLTMGEVGEKMGLSSRRVEQIRDELIDLGFLSPENTPQRMGKIWGARGRTKPIAPVASSETDADETLVSIDELLYGGVEVGPHWRI